MFMFYWYNIVISDVSNLPSCQGCHVSAYVPGCAVEVKIGPAHMFRVFHIINIRRIHGAHFINESSYYRQSEIPERP